MVQRFPYPDQSFLCSTAGTDLCALLANQTHSPPQQGDQIQPPPFEAHPHYRHPTPYITLPYHQEKAPQLLSLHDEAEEEHHDNRFDQPNPNQLNYDESTTSKNLRMDGSGCGSESGGWRREGWGDVVNNETLLHPFMVYVLFSPEMRSPCQS